MTSQPTVSYYIQFCQTSPTACGGATSPSNSQEELHVSQAFEASRGTSRDCFHCGLTDCQQRIGSAFHAHRFDSQQCKCRHCFQYRSESCQCLGSSAIL